MEHNHPTSLNKRKSGEKRLLLVVAVATAATLSCYLILNSSTKNESVKGNPPETASNTTTLPTSADMKQTGADQYEPGNRGIEESYSENYIVLPVHTGDQSFKFGDKVYIDNQYSNRTEATIYQHNPADSNGTKYKITQHAERGRSTICYGDFDADGQKDVAIVADNNEKQCSRLLIICTNITTREKYLAFSENYPDKIKINAFRKGTKITMNKESLEASAIDGIIVNGEDVKLAIVFDKQLRKFKTFYQE